MSRNTNIILKSDSYKFSHYLQYPENTTSSFFYIESRGGLNPKTLFFGLQYYIKEYLLAPITQENIDEAEVFASKHGVPFNKDGWQYILDQHEGYLPLRIRAVPEGTMVNNHNVLVTIESTDPKTYWLPSYMETLLMKVWYPITVATRSKYLRNMIYSALVKSSDTPESIDFKLASFGYRGVSSEESAAIGGAAELISFKGSDTVAGVLCANDYYNCDMSGFSLPASEHSTITSYGKENECEAYRNMLNHFAKPGKIMACVSDSYDLFNAIENYWGKELKEQVINSGATIVIRPDSGEPVEIVLKTVQLLDKCYGSTINSKGYKLLNYVRVIQGDGINEDSIPLILNILLDNGYSTENLALGMGSGMIQELRRDTYKFAMKNSSITVNGIERDVFKDPITDHGKKSKAGRLDLIIDNGEYKTVKLIGGAISDSKSVMRVVYENGKLIVDDNLDTIRTRALNS